MESPLLLKVTYKALKQYYSQFGYTKDTEYIRKRLTRDFILGVTDINKSDFTIEARLYGHLKIVVNKQNFIIIGVFNNLDRKVLNPVNYAYRRELSKMYGIRNKAKKVHYLQDYSHLRLSREDLGEGMNNLDKADEVRRLCMEGLNFNAAMRKTFEMFKHDIEDGQVFDTNTSETIRDLI